MTASGRESVALGFGNAGARFLSRRFALSQSSGGVFGVPGPLPPDKQSAPSPYGFCTLASLRHSSKPCYCCFSFDVQN